MTTTPTEPADDFEIAKGVFGMLKDLSKERQERVLRWVAEGLGLGQAAAPRPDQSAGPAARPPAESAQSPSPPQTPKDIKSFVAMRNPRSDQQFATVVAYYYRFEAPPAQRRETVNPEIVQEATRLVGRDRLTSPQSTLNNARNQGYLDRSARGEYSINTVGENLVAMALTGSEEASKVKSKKSGKKTKRGTAGRQ